MVCEVNQKSLRELNILEEFEALKTQAEQVAFIRYTFGKPRENASDRFFIWQNILLLNLAPG